MAPVMHSCTLCMLCELTLGHICIYIENINVKNDTELLTNISSLAQNGQTDVICQ